MREQISPQDKDIEIPVHFEDNPFRQELRERGFEDPEACKAVAAIFADPKLNPQTALELLADMNLKVSPGEKEEEIKKLIESYGLDPGLVSEQDKMRVSILKSASEKARSKNAENEISGLLDQIVSEQLFIAAIKEIDDFAMVLKESKSEPEVLKSALKEIMRMMSELGKHVPPEHAGKSPYWEAIYQRFRFLVEEKKGSGREISKIFSEIFDEYSEFIDKEFIPYEYKRISEESELKTGSMEHVVREAYGRTGEEAEVLKQRNRLAVLKKLEELSEKDTFENNDLIELLRTNNKGILPEASLRFRSLHHEAILFGGKRMGILPEDVAEEMARFEDRAQKVLYESSFKDWSKAKFEIAVAQLHNELLEIHPFTDRNGSTSLLFMELMMMRRGYKPDAKREENYYKNVSNVLGLNPVAIGLVGYEMYRQTHEYGYFEGETTKRQGKKERYEFELKETYGLWKKGAKPKK